MSLPKYLTLCLGILLAGCLFDSASVKKTGTGEETTNGIYGLVTYGNKPAVGVSVSLFSKNYQPLEKDRFWQTRLDTITDTNGYYHFHDLEKGEYNIVTNEADRNLGAMVQDIGVLTNTQKVNAAKAILTTTGSISISLNELNPTVGAYIYFQGTNFYGRITQDNIDQGFVNFTGLPAGEYQDIMYLEKLGAESVKILNSNLVVTSGKNPAPDPFAAWQYSADIHINTSNSGANISSNLYGFPVMIRLTAANFPFATANSQGDDIRFAKMDHSPLAFEIEYWNSTEETAIVWVAMDTLKGNASDQTIQLHWGNSRALPKSNGPAVFNPKNGYSGVWHLSDNRQDFTITESSGGQYSGIARNVKTEIESKNISSQGMIGRGINLTNQEWIDLGKGRNYLNGQAAATLSGWFKPVFDSTKAPVTMGILNIGVGQEDSSISTRAGVDIVDERQLIVRARALDTVSGATSVTQNEKLISNNWHYFTAVVNYGTDSLYLYIDGSLAAVNHKAFPVHLTENTNSKSSAIGAQDNGNGNYFNGQLDEMRVSRGINSPAWIKMCYENQKPASNVVTIGKINSP